MEDDQQKPKQPLIPLTPVPLRHRNDGLERSAQPVRGTGEHYSEKQYAFLEALAENGIVEDTRPQPCWGHGEDEGGRSLPGGGQASTTIAAPRARA